ncbi:hypothetical protein GCM10025865_12740 [Paraoerskovia sediminicola]|uniref:Secreted protein n=1 Tax=Paraoerskovia sediminicola TaxID=1138587 RepID=A0ABM8G1J9_9CELL|nr:hypothetical protein [Paraoerskovia sediminicola]BDZ41975.1 hypothetical protein GCM10025865_12740 [Paraoerskovia sediminicola]
MVTHADTSGPVAAAAPVAGTTTALAATIAVAASKVADRRERVPILAPSRVGREARQVQVDLSHIIVLLRGGSVSRNSSVSPVVIHLLRRGAGRVRN